MGFVENDLVSENPNRVFAGTIFALFIGFVIVMGLLFYDAKIYDSNSYNLSYNIARNNTVQQWNQNYTITDKLNLIKFNCETTFANANKCKADLAKELI